MTKKRDSYRESKNEMINIKFNNNNKKRERKEKTMKKWTGILMASILVLGMTGMSMAQGSDNHNVSIQVSSVNAIDVDDGGSGITLEVTSATPGSDLGSDTDNTTTLSWTANANNRVVKVYADAAPNWPLSVAVDGAITKNAGSGTPAAAGTISMTTASQTLITGAGKAAADCSLLYTLNPDVDDDPGVAQNLSITYELTTP